MQRSALRTLLLAVLCLSVLALAAATLDTTQTDGSGFGSGGGGGGDTGGDPSPPPQQPREPGTSQEPSQQDRYELCAPWVSDPPVVIAVVAAAVVTFLALLRRYDEFVAVAGTLIVFGPVTLLMLVLAECGLETPDPDIPPNVTSGNGSTGGGSAGGSGSAVPDPTLPLVAVVGIGVLIALVAVAYYLTGDDTGGAAGEEAADAEAEDDPAVDATDVAEVGRLAGEAADRIEGAEDFENEVYRAWREMTRPLNVDRPRSSSPGEFARAAAAAGMDRGSVDRLTELFDEVRYGGFEATPEREREAVSLLRSIEEQYADVETPADLSDAGSDPDGTGAGDADGEGDDR